jgi:DcaP outer membrane protein
MTPRKPVNSALRCFVWAAVVLSAIASAHAQSTAPPVEGSSQAPPTEKAQPAQTEPKPDGFTVGGFTFKPGGRVKLDIIRDFNPITNEDAFDTRAIAVDGSEGTNSNLIAKESRLFLDMRGPVEGRELRMYLETDFYGSSSVLRLRHAYGSYGGLLAGQTWSTFVDENNMPNTIDFESPTAFPSTRQAQARWTQKLGTKATWAIAVEDNKSSITTPTGVAGKAEYSMPDLATRVRFEGSRGHVHGAFFFGKARFRPTTGEPDNVSLWGANLSTKIKTFGRDYIYAQYTFGDGVGRYRGGVTAVPDANNQLHAVGINAITGGYEHFWSPRYSSNLVYSVATVPEETFYASTFNKRLDYGAVNLLYWFLPGRAWAGVEYLYGRREVFGGDVGDANRLQFAVRFNFP